MTAEGREPMNATELDVGEATPSLSASPRKAALKALERLLRAHVTLSEQRDSEGAYSLLRPAKEEEIDLVEAVFSHCGVPLPDTLRAIYRRTLGIANPLSRLPVLAVPFLRAALPDDGFGHPIVGLDAFEKELGLNRDEAAFERPPFLHLGHAAPLGLTVSRNGLWSLQDYQESEGLPHNEEFNLHFEAAFCAFVDQVLLLWANDLAGDLVKHQDLGLIRGARLSTMPLAVQEARALLVAPRTLSPKTWADVQPLDNADLLRTTRRGEGSASIGPLGWQTAVVGLPYSDHPEVAAGIKPGTLLRLHPVDDNPHDPNAVEVWHDGEISIRVGYVERQDAPNYRNLPQGVSAWRIRVTGRSDYAIYAMLEMLRTEDAALPDRGAPQQGRTPLGQGEDLFSQELRPESHNGRPVGPAVDSREQASAKPVSGDKGQEDDHGSARLVL